MSATPRYDGSGLHARTAEPWALFVATLVIGAILLAAVVLAVPQPSALQVCLAAGGVDPAHRVLVDRVEVTALEGDRQLVVGRLHRGGLRGETMRCTVLLTDDGPVVERIEGLRG